MLPLSLFPAEAPFVFGVASGDPTAYSILLWTAFDSNEDNVFEVEYDIWPKDSFPAVEGFSGRVFTSLESDHTVTVEVDNLAPGTEYFYQFSLIENGVRAGRSEIGETKTLPTTGEDFVLAATSCTSLFSGYLHSYRSIAEDDEIDLVLHLGDYVYPDVDPEECNRIPTGVCLTDDNFKDCLGKTAQQKDQSEYITAFAERYKCDMSEIDKMRWIHKLYHLDPSVRAARRRHPFVVVWDNHDLSSTDIREFSQGLQAFIEHVPIRFEGVEEEININRHFTVGEDFLHLVTLDTMEQKDSASLLGNQQLVWLRNVLEEPEPRWRVVGQQKVIMPFALNKVHEQVFLVAFSFWLGLLFVVLLSRYLCFRLKREEGEEKKMSFVSSLHQRNRVNCCCLTIFGLILLLILIAVGIVGKELNKNDIVQLDNSDDVWQGNLFATRELLGTFDDAGKNNIFIAGDIHMTIFSEVFLFDSSFSSLETGSSDRIGIEIIPTSGSRGNLDEKIEEISGLPQGSLLNNFVSSVAQDAIVRSNPHFSLFEGFNHGYGKLHFQGECLQVTMRYFDTRESSFIRAKMNTITRDFNNLS